MRNQWILGILAVLIALIYGQTARHGFINYDDELYVTAQPIVQEGLTFEGARWAFTNVEAANWHPLTWLSHMVDCQIFGMRAGGHHFMSALIHFGTAAMFFLALTRLTGAGLAARDHGGLSGGIWPCAFAAALFAVHPLRVESVAWVAERKDVLSGLLFFTTLWAYGVYARRPGWLPYGVVVLSLAGALMAKSMVVTLPFVLLLLDYWPLRRFETGRATRLVLEKLPLLALAAGASVMAVYAQREAAAVAALGDYTLGVRLANGAVAYGVYLWQTVYPVNLALYYPHPGDYPAAWKIAGSVAVILVVSGIAAGYRRKAPYLFTGWFWFLGMLVPVIGLVQIGDQAHADRYTYLPHGGLFVAVAWGVWGLVERGRVPFTVFVAAGGVAVAALTGVAAWQTSHWRDSESVFLRAIHVTGGSSKVHNNLGTALYAKGGVTEAEEQFRLALEFSPGNLQARNNLGAALLARNEAEAAIAEFLRVLEHNPEDASVHLNVAVALMALGREEEARHWAEEALLLDPRYSLADVFLRRHSLR